VPRPQYGTAHQLRRKRLAPLVEAGMVRCARCGELIRAGEPFDLGHVDGSGYAEWSGAEHRKCNRRTAAHKKERVRRWSRQW
jgi:hypothetical protein